MLYINPSTCTPYTIHRARIVVADGANTGKNCQHIAIANKLFEQEEGARKFQTMTSMIRTYINLTYIVAFCTHKSQSWILMAGTNSFFISCFSFFLWLFFSYFLQFFCCCWFCHSILCSAWVRINPIFLPFNWIFAKLA